MAHPGGRPRKIKAPETLQTACDIYFGLCDDAKKPYTLTGLALFCGFCSREDFLLQKERGDKFSDVVKKAVGKVAESFEERLAGNAVAGPIFWLKNHGWSDQQQHTLSNPDGSNLLTGINIVFRKPDDKA